MKAVFDTKPKSGYDDDLTRHYQFPSRYADIVRQAEGDWVVLRRPRADGGNLAYFAVARVVGLERDPASPSLTYAKLSEYFAFDRPVAWRNEGRYAEQALRDLPVREVGVQLRGRSVRALSDADFAEIVITGMEATLEPANARRLGLDRLFVEMTRNDLHATPLVERERKVVQLLTNRVIRDASFRRGVTDAYKDTCAVTRLRIINGGGRSEVQAAHIWPVASGGPDVVPNGIALSGTIHWLFDRHLISLTDDYRLLVSHNRVPPEFQQLFARAGELIHLPDSPAQRPHPGYIAKHRAIYDAASV